MEEPLDPDARERQQRVRQVTFGALVVAAGIILVLHQLSIFYVFGLWPLLLVGLGLTRLLSACCPASRRSGAWLLAIGLWFSLSEFTPIRYRESWPLLLLIVGALIVWDAAAPARRCALCAEGHHAR